MKRTGALISHHKRGLHAKNLEPECPECVSPDGSAPAHAPALAVARGQASASPVDVDSASTCSDETETQTETQTETFSSSSTVTQRPAPPTVSDDDGERYDAQLVIDQLGIVDATPTKGEQRTIARARARGWTLAQLHDKARAAATAGNPRAYLRTSLNEAANTKPPPQPARPPSEGMSPPVGPQWYELPEPEPETGRAGLAAARAALDPRSDP